MSHYNDVYILGVATYPATLREDGRRLEELVYDTSRRALDHAGINRRQLDNVVLGACDELDGRPISSMLMTAPAGGYLTDEIKVTDCGAMALCLEYARIRSGEFNIGLVASWCKSSKTDVSAVMRLRGDPFFTRPLGLDGVVTDALFAQAVAGRYRIDAAEASQRAAAASQRGASNPRGLQAASVGNTSQRLMAGFRRGFSSRVLLASHRTGQIEMIGDMLVLAIFDHGEGAGAAGLGHRLLGISGVEGAELLGNLAISGERPVDCNERLQGMLGEVFGEVDFVGRSRAGSSHIRRALLGHQVGAEARQCRLAFVSGCRDDDGEGRPAK